MVGAQFPKRKVGDCGVESPRFGEVSVYSARVNIGGTILTSPLDIGGLRFPLATHTTQMHLYNIMCNES